MEKEKISLEQNEILVSVEKEKLKSNQQIEIEQRKLKVKETELDNLLSNYSLSKSLETVALLRYKNDDPTNENISCKKAAKDVPDVIMQDDFLDGHCASLINKKLEER